MFRQLPRGQRDVCFGNISSLGPEKGSVRESFELCKCVGEALGAERLSIFISHAN